MAQRRLLPKINDDIDFRDHQVEGVRRMIKMTGGLLADDMGLGKSLQILTTAAVAFEDEGLSRVLSVSPLSLKYNWQDEMDEHTSYSYHVLDGTPKQRDKQLAEFDAEVLVVNYEQVVAHLDTLNDMGFGFVLLDEGHYIKGRKTKRTKACHKLKIPRRWILTGSPILNQVDDLWAILHFIDPISFPKFWSFVNRYAVWGGYMDKQIVGVKNEAELKEIVDRYMIRRTKSELGMSYKQPPIVEKLELSKAQKKMYDQAKEELKIDIPSADALEIDNAMVKLLRLKQICGTTAAIEGHDDDSAKLDRAEEIVQELIDRGEPVVIFTQFRSVLACIVQRLEARKIKAFQIHGDIPGAERPGIVKQWTHWSKSEPAAICCTIQTAGTGLNMVAANHVIFLDRLFTPKLNEQAEDRLDRIGQTKPVTIIDFEMRGTVEHRVKQINKKKKELFGMVIGDGDTSFKRKLLAAIIDDDEVDE